MTVPVNLVYSSALFDIQPTLTPNPKTGTPEVLSSIVEVLAAVEYSAASLPITSSPCATCYLSADHLGSTRLVTDAWGNVIGRHDYFCARLDSKVVRGSTRDRSGQSGQQSAGLRDGQRNGRHAIHVGRLDVRRARLADFQRLVIAHCAHLLFVQHLYRRRESYRRKHPSDGAVSGGLGFDRAHGEHLHCGRRYGRRPQYGDLLEFSQRRIRGLERIRPRTDSYRFG